MLGTHRNHLDFEILETGNPKTLVFVDSSQYMEKPDRPLIEVYLPAFRKYLLANVVSSQVNTFNSSTLGLNQALGNHDLIDLPDGVWTIRYKICPYDYTFIDKKHMRVTILMGKLNRLYAHVQIDECSCPTKEDVFIKERLAQVHILIEGAKAVVRVDENKASRYYQLADKLIDELLQKFCKNCN